MGLKRYYCRRSPTYMIGATIRFIGGYYQTDVEYEQKIIEGDDWFGDIIREIPAPSDVQMPVAGFKSYDRSLFSSLAIDDVDLDDHPAQVPPPVKATDNKPVSKPVNKLTATDIVKLKRKDLESVARELALETTGNMIKLKSRIRQKLGV